MLLDFIDLQSGTGAIYKRLYGAVYAAILSGVIKDGERLPSIREAAAQLSVSRTTVENAYLRLCMEGLAESLPQRGYFIRGVLPAKPVIPEEIKKYEIRYDFSGKNSLRLCRKSSSSSVRQKFSGGAASRTTPA